MSQPATGRGRAAPSNGMAPAPVSVDAPRSASTSHVPKRAVCPICATTFEPRASGGQCPVCGEQVVPVAAVTRQIPVLSPARRWLADGGWRLVLVLLLVVYQFALLIFVWVQLAHKHLI